jgi:hypothetical protein
MTHDPLEPVIEWIYPKTDRYQILRNKNFLFANDTISDATPSNAQDIEYIFYNPKMDVLIIVEPIRVLQLLNITMLDRGDGAYTTLPITVEEWEALHSQLTYVGII